MVSTVINLMLIGLIVLAVVLFILAPVIVPIITPGFEGAKLDRTIELTRIMLLSPIFLAMGAVATSVLNAGGRFAASAIAPIVYNLAIIGGALILGPRFGVEGLAASVVAGSLGHVLVQLRPLVRMGFRYDARIESGDPQARKALLLMAPRAIGLGVTQITFIVVTALASLLGDGAVSDFNFAFALLQIPLGIIGVPLGIVVLPSLSRDAAVGHEVAFASLLTRALRLLIYVMVPIAILTAVIREPVVDSLFGGGSIRPGRPRPHRGHARRVLGRADRARDDRRPRPCLLRAPGHGHAGRRGGRCGRRQLHARGRAGGTRSDCPASPSPSPSPPGSRRWSCWRSCTAACRISSWPASPGSGSRLSSAASSPAIVAVPALGAVSGMLGAEPGRILLLVEAAAVSVVFGVVYALVSLALRIPELPSIVGVMADLVRRPVRS